MEIKGKRILITGANRGLGRALAFAFAREGAAEVLAGARKPEDFAALAKETEANGLTIRPIQLDVTSDTDLAMAEKLGAVDILINNAGTLAVGGVFKARLDDIEREIAVNYLGVVKVVRAFVPLMAAKGDGLIVNIASILGKVNLPAIGTYCATKAALFSLTQAIRADLADRGVRAIAVFPGTIDTDMARGFDIPKMPVEQAVTEILQAIRTEANETAIGDESRGVLAGLAADPAGIEKAFAQYRA